MTSNELYCNFVSSKRKADELEKIAQELKRLADGEFENNIQSISTVWTGEGSNMFKGKSLVLKNDIMLCATSLEKTAETIRIVATRIYNSEMNALKIAKERKYK